MLKCFHLLGQNGRKNALQTPHTIVGIYIQLLIPYENTTDLIMATDATPTLCPRIYCKGPLKRMANEAALIVELMIFLI